MLADTADAGREAVEAHGSQQVVASIQRRDLKGNGEVLRTDGSETHVARSRFLDVLSPFLEWKSKFSLTSQTVPRLDAITSHVCLFNFNNILLTKLVASCYQ